VCIHVAHREDNSTGGLLIYLMPGTKPTTVRQKTKVLPELRNRPGTSGSKPSTLSTKLLLGTIKQCDRADIMDIAVNATTCHYLPFYLINLRQTFYLLICHVPWVNKCNLLILLHQHSQLVTSVLTDIHYITRNWLVFHINS